jgi:hypothetical protein
MARTIAIVERLDGHTETMGGFAALALALGYEVHLLYNRQDEFHMVDYFRQRIPAVACRVHDWSIITESSVSFDIILLNTSDIWLDYATLLTKWNIEQRLIVVHHRPDYVALMPDVHAHVSLTPAAGQGRWIFPLYSNLAYSSRTGVLLPTRAAAPFRSCDGGELPTLVNIGTLRTKDKSAIADYLALGGRVVHYGRTAYHHFSRYEGRFIQNVGLSSVALIESICRREAPVFLWCPVPPDSDYTVFRFTGALALGVELGCVMLMPEKLRILYEFPKQAVITYETSILEQPCLRELCAPPGEHLKRREALSAWAAERWNLNLEVFDSTIQQLDTRTSIP